MPIPKFIDGVLVCREQVDGLGASNRVKFCYHRYSFPSTALKPGTFSPSICSLNQLFRIRILYMHIPSQTDSTRHIDPDIFSFFFRHWLYMAEDRTESRVYSATHIVFFREDFKPLDPKQAEVLWRFCDRIFLVISVPHIENILPAEISRMILWVRAFQYLHRSIRGTMRRPWFEHLVNLMRDIWASYCTVDNFNAFFELYRYGRLLKGDSCWRDVKSPCDV